MQFVVGRGVGRFTSGSRLVLILTAIPALAQDEAAKTPTPAEEEDEKEAIDRTRLPFCERLGSGLLAGRRHRRTNRDGPTDVHPGQHGRAQGPAPDRVGVHVRP